MEKDQKIALLLIDVQKGFHDSYWGNRNNRNAELNMKNILAIFRINGNPVVHVQHLSTNPSSPLEPNSEGVHFIDGLGPINDERVFQKNVNSAFIGTDLECFLKSRKIETLFLAGFTSDHCVSTSARMAANLGFKVFIISDATVTFDRALNGITFPADLVHQVSLASLEGEFATVLCSSDILQLKA